MGLKDTHVVAAVADTETIADIGNWEKSWNHHREDALASLIATRSHDAVTHRLISDLFQAIQTSDTDEAAREKQKGKCLDSIAIGLMNGLGNLIPPDHPQSLFLTQSIVTAASNTPSMQGEMEMTQAINNGLRGVGTSRREALAHGIKDGVDELAARQGNQSQKFADTLSRYFAALELCHPRTAVEAIHDVMITMATGKRAANDHDRMPKLFVAQGPWKKAAVEALVGIAERAMTRGDSYLAKEAVDYADQIGRNEKADIVIRMRAVYRQLEHINRPQRELDLGLPVVFDPRFTR